MLLGWLKVKNAWQWTVPFCAFFTTFTIVMTVLVLSTDFKGPHYVHFNNTNIWEFEDLYQDSPLLINLIRDNYLSPPNENIGSKFNVSRTKLSPELYDLLNKKSGGVYIECDGGSRGVTSGTDVLEAFFGWTGLITQPHPEDYAAILVVGRPRAYTSNICISPATSPKHAAFRRSSFSTEEKYNSSLTTVPCFPLYSLILALNSTSVDLLVLNLLSAELQILKTIPFNRASIQIISIMNSANRDPCCQQELVLHLQAKGYSQLSACPSLSDRCYFALTNTLTSSPP